MSRPRTRPRRLIRPAELGVLDYQRAAGSGEREWARKRTLENKLGRFSCTPVFGVGAWKKK